MSAVSMLDEAEEFLHLHKFEFRMADVAAARVLTLLGLGDLAAAARLAETYELPISQARVHLACGDPAATSTLLKPWREHVEAKGWADERLKVMLLQTLALDTHGDRDHAVQELLDALTLGEPGGVVRSFVDEGVAMAQLLVAAAPLGRMPSYTAKLHAAFESKTQKREGTSSRVPALSEPLSRRELEVLRLITQGLSNHEIGERLVLALDTVKGHNRRIFGKLQVQRRTEAVARARELGLS